MRSGSVGMTIVVCLAASAAGTASAGEPTGAAMVASQAAGPADAAATAPASADAAPRWKARSSWAEGTYRSALSRGGLDLGLRFDTPARSARAGDAPIDPVLAYTTPAPTLSLGVRSTSTGAAPTAGSLVERATGAGIGVQAERKVGLEWKPAPSRLFLNRGVGIRLDGDDRVTMRLKKGSLGLYVQGAF